MFACQWTKLLDILTQTFGACVQQQLDLVYLRKEVKSKVFKNECKFVNSESGKIRDDQNFI